MTKSSVIIIRNIGSSNSGWSYGNKSSSRSINYSYSSCSIVISFLVFKYDNNKKTRGP